MIMKSIGRGVILKHFNSFLTALDPMLSSLSPALKEAAEECIIAIQDVCGVQSVVNKLNGLDCFDK